MCGIAGFVGKHSKVAVTERAAVLDEMCRTLAQRGPDGQGVHLTSAAALGMRRLAIIDLDSGQQPMSGCDAALTLVFNGEIYNYRELRQQLTALGHRFRTASDTETIIHAYEEYGAECVQHLRGMFAFAIWDARDQSLFLARDRVGKKPLYYTITPTGELIFGSELKALRRHPAVPRDINLAALDAYLSFGYVPDPQSIFRGVHKLPPGHHLTFADGRTQLTEYWDFTYTEPKSERPPEAYRQDLRELLRDAVQVRMLADVPVGAFLSGGVDSSAIVALMAQAGAGRVKTFSVGFTEDSHNELEYARLVAQRYQTDHHETIVTPDWGSLTEELVRYFDEPFADSSAIPSYVVAKLAREQVKVVLTGDGGDELFAGYVRYDTTSWQSGWSRLPRAVRHGVMQPLGRRLPHGAWGRNYLHDVAFDPLERYVENISSFSQLNKHSLYTRAFQAQLPALSSAPAVFRGYAERVQSRELMAAALYLDSKTYLPGDILTKVDRVTMAASLEARTPLLDQKLIEFVTRLPSHLKRNGDGTAKRIFKDAVRDLVPPEILARPKQGFELPLQHWIKHALQDVMHETLTARRTLERGYFSPRHIALLLDEHRRGRRNHAAKLWTLYVLELWHRAFIDEL